MLNENRAYMSTSARNCALYNNYAIALGRWARVVDRNLDTFYNGRRRLFGCAEQPIVGVNMGARLHLTKSLRRSHDLPAGSEPTFFG